MHKPMRFKLKISAGFDDHHEKEGLMRMNLGQCFCVLAVALGIGMIGGTVRAAASPVPQEQTHASQDYSNNKKYQQGLSEGRNDLAHKRDHSKKRHFKKDDDQKAYDAGYRQGHQDDPRSR